MSKAKQTTDGRADTDPLIGHAVMFDVLKGGVGKSALSLNVADVLASRGHDVLYMDLDPNGHITSVLDFDDVFHEEMHDYGFVCTDFKFYGKFDKQPEDMIYETDWGFDFVPSFDDMESFDGALSEMDNSSQVLAEGFIRPLYEAGEYDYFIMDGGGERSKVADNGFYAGRRAVVPLEPGKESFSALKRTFDRIIQPLQSGDIGFEVLALVPNKLSQRIDQNTDDRELLWNLNASEKFNHLVPSFARITEAEWDSIDDGNLIKPGIRQDAAIKNGIKNGMPARHYDPEFDQLENFEVLAERIEQSGDS